MLLQVCKKNFNLNLSSLKRDYNGQIKTLKISIANKLNEISELDIKITR